MPVQATIRERRLGHEDRRPILLGRALETSAGYLGEAVGATAATLTPPWATAGVAGTSDPVPRGGPLIARCGPHRSLAAQLAASPASHPVLKATWRL